MTLLILFCAAQAPELVGRDQRHRVLVLYFSRALERADYALAKLAAMVTALILVYAAPLLLMFAGRIFAGSDVPTALADNLQAIAPAVLVAPLMALVLGGISLAAASLTPRRAYATAGIIAIFIIPPLVIAVAQEVARGGFAQYIVLLGPAQVLDGVNAFLFGRTPSDEMVQFARLPGTAVRRRCAGHGGGLGRGPAAALPADRSMTTDATQVVEAAAAGRPGDTARRRRAPVGLALVRQRRRRQRHLDRDRVRGSPASSGPTARASRRCSTCCPGSCAPRRARC